MYHVLNRIFLLFAGGLRGMEGQGGQRGQGYLSGRNQNVYIVGQNLELRGQRY